MTYLLLVAFKLVDTLIPADYEDFKLAITIWYLKYAVRYILEQRTPFGLVAQLLLGLFVMRVNKGKIVDWNWCYDRVLPGQIDWLRALVRFRSLGMCSWCGCCELYCHVVGDTSDSRI